MNVSQAKNGLLKRIKTEDKQKNGGTVGDKKAFFNSTAKFFMKIYQI